MSTYWSSQSFRTLNHWQSGKTQVSYKSVTPSTNTVTGDGKFYGLYPCLRFPGATGTGFNITITQSLNQQGSEIYREEQYADSSTVLSIVDLGETKLEIVPLAIPDGAQYVEVQTGYDFGNTYRIFSIDEEIKVGCIIPTVHRYLVKVANFSTEHADLLPSWITFNKQTTALMHGFSAYNCIAGSMTSMSVASGQPNLSVALYRSQAQGINILNPKSFNIPSSWEMDTLNGADQTSRITGFDYDESTAKYKNAGIITTNNALETDGTAKVYKINLAPQPDNITFGLDDDVTGSIQRNATSVYNASYGNYVPQIIGTLDGIAGYYDYKMLYTNPYTETTSNAGLCSASIINQMVRYDFSEEKIAEVKK